MQHAGPDDRLRNYAAEWCVVEDCPFGALESIPKDESWQDEHEDDERRQCDVHRSRAGFKSGGFGNHRRRQAAVDAASAVMQDDDAVCPALARTRLADGDLTQLLACARIRKDPLRELALQCFHLRFPVRIGCRRADIARTCLRGRGAQITSLESLCDLGT